VHVTRLRFVSSSAVKEVPAAPRLGPRFARSSDDAQWPGDAGLAGVATCTPGVVVATVVGVLTAVVAVMVAGPRVRSAEEEQAVKAKAGTRNRPSQRAMFMALQMSHRLRACRF